MNFPQGSEIIISAMNIPDIVCILHHHGLKIVTIDVAMETMAPKTEWLEDLITEKTVAILVAHLYGKWFNLDPFILVAKRHKLCIIEDCAEVFYGLKHVGHVEADITLFSFGVIKHCTAFGGAIAKIRDEQVYNKMHYLYSTFPSQAHSNYLSKVLKYSLIYLLLNCPKNLRFVLYFSRKIGFDVKNYMVSCLRGFPQDLIRKLRYQPCTALLIQMHERFYSFSFPDFSLANTKGDYVCHRLPEDVIHVGTEAKINNYWLFPIVVVSHMIEYYILSGKHMYLS